jgi:hypothetical protein
MKHKSCVMSIAMAALVLVSLGAACASVSAAPANSANVQTPPLVGASVVGAPAVSSQDGGKSQDLFVRGTNGSIYWKHSNDGKTWPSTATCLGGYATSDPAAVSPSSGTIVVLVRGGGVGALWSRYTTDGGQNWKNWANAGGKLLEGTGPTAYKWGSANYWFVTGTDHALWWMGPAGPNWQSLGGYLTSSPSVAAALNTAPTPWIDVSARGGDNALWYIATSNGGGTWDHWASQGGKLLAGTGPAAYSYGSTFSGVLVTGTNHSLYNTELGTSGYRCLGGYVTSSPGATLNWPNTLDAFGRGSNGALWVDYQTPVGLSGTWSGWTSIGGI